MFIFIQYASEELGVDPTKCWAVEDSPNGCRSARAAGMKVLGCPNDVTRWFFEDELCDVRVESLLDWVHLLTIAT